MIFSKLKNIHKDPILLLILFTMASSSMISFFMVNSNIHKIEMLESEIRDNKMMISELSDNVNQKYSQVNALVLLNFVTNKNDEKAEMVKEKYLEVLPNLTVTSSVMEILEEFEKYRGEQFEKINDSYAEQISLEKEQSALEMKNKIYSAIATMLQIIGLVLIFIRRDSSVENIY